MIKNNLLFFLLLIIVFSCKRGETVVDSGYEYYPLSKGDYKIYNVVSIQYSTTDTIMQSYQIKELVSDTFSINNEKRYRLERYKRLSESDSWSEFPDSVWSAVLTSSKAIRIENNTRFVKLVFPVRNAVSWDGNSENSRGEDLYSISGLGGDFKLLGINYSNTLNVIESPNDSNFVNKDYRKDVYGKNLGLIYKVKEVYTYKQNGANFTKYKIDSGIKYYESLSSYGKQ